MKDIQASAHEALTPRLLELVHDVRKGGKRVRESGLAEAPEAASADDEAVHDFRVALRKLRTLLRSARWVYGKKQTRDIANDLRAFARATGALRDEEVLRETLKALELSGPDREELDAWIRHRAGEERARRVEVVELLHAGEGVWGKRKRRGPDLTAPLAALTKLLHRGKQVHLLTAGALARRAAEQASQKVRAGASADPGDVAAMHELRIRFKNLRYTADLLAPLLGEGADRIAKAAHRMQRRLGDLHDIDEALACIEQTRQLSAPVQTATLSALQAARREGSERAQRELAEAMHMLDRGFGEEPAAPGSSERTA